jgi:hypothetical protein
MTGCDSRMSTILLFSQWDSGCRSRIFFLSNFHRGGGEVTQLNILRKRADPSVFTAER